MIDARDPAALRPLVGLPPYRRALLAAHEAGRAPLGLIAPPERGAELVAACRADLRLQGLQIELAEPDDLRPRLDGACVLDAESALAVLEGRNPTGAFLPADAPDALKRAALLRGSANRADGFVDTWLNRRLSRFMTRWVVGTGISPNAVTVISCLVGLLGAAGVASRDPRLGIAGALVFQLSAAVDCVDGEIARLTHRSTPFGARLDLALDNLVHLALFAAAAWASAPLLGLPAALAWGGAALLGASLSFLVVYAGTFGAPHGSATRVEALLERCSSRDFSLGVIAAACWGRWDLLVITIALGSNVFWPVLLATLRRTRGG